MTEAKARELVAKADKKLSSWFASMTGTKYEDAEEIYKAAANQFKAAKLCAPVQRPRPPASLGRCPRPTLIHDRRSRRRRCCRRDRGRRDL